MVPFWSCLPRHRPTRRSRLPIPAGPVTAKASILYKHGHGSRNPNEMVASPSLLKRAYRPACALAAVVIGLAGATATAAESDWASADPAPGATVEAPLLPATDGGPGRA